MLIENEIFFTGIVSAAMKNKVSCLYIHVHVASVRDLINACNISSLDINFFLFQTESPFCKLLFYFMYWANTMYVIFIIQVTYNYKLRLEKQSGDILSSHCECPAGKGPNGTCKHLAAVMVMLEKFIGLGELTGIEKTCTESLMMFNKPKTSHKGLHLFTC